MGTPRVLNGSLARLALLTCLLAAAPANAAPTGFALDHFEPAERGSSWFVLDPLAFRGSGMPAVGTTLDQRSRPLAVYNNDGSVRAAIVGNAFTTHLGANVVLWDRLRVGANLPVVLYTNGSQTTLQGVTYDPPSSQTTVGDLRLGTDLRLFGSPESAFTSALGARLWIPTGSPSAYTGDGAVRAGPRFSAAGSVKAFVWAANAGVTFRSATTPNFAGSPIGHELPFGVSAGVRVAENKLTVGPELYGSTVLAKEAFKTRTTPLELLLGFHYLFRSTLRAGAAAGAGLVSGYGAPAYRVMGSFEWAAEWTPPPKPDRDGDGVPDDQDACPDKKGQRSNEPDKNGCGEPDFDGDGIPDSADACPDSFGKRTNDPRTNGCDDRDQDGILDPLDACPTVPGIASPDPKKNGCPPPPGDKDGDGITDDVDACPDVKGEPNATDPKQNGCPLPDADHDGIPDKLDSCPQQPGKANADPNKNGCPVVFLMGSQIVLRQPLLFSGRADAPDPGPDSEEVLKAVLEVINAHPEFTLIRVEGHTDNRGGFDNNKRLSAKRAGAVVTWLREHGVDNARLKSVGVGQERPLEPNDTEEGRANNHRVELYIEKKAGSP
jgi:outer membrane protein OmpA-like peptidoglycan-associated protein